MSDEQRGGTLAGKRILVTGASRGIGKAIALRAARDGARIAVVAKTVEPHPKLPGTIFTAVEEIQAAGGEGLACVADIRFEDQVEAAVEKAVEQFGGLDVLVNNASAIFLAGTAETPMKRFDLMHAVNVRGTFLVSQKCIPHLVEGDNPHILNIAPPLNLESRWFGPHVAYTMSKYGMSMCVLGMAEELRGQGIAVNALWPKTVIGTAAVQNLLGGDEAMRRTRLPAIMGDAAQRILTKTQAQCNGKFLIDEDVLIEAGQKDFEQYASEPGADLLPDIFL